MNNKETFLKAVQILAPDNQFIRQAANCVSEESLPAATGAAALEFVVEMQRLTNPAWPCMNRFKLTRRRPRAHTSHPVAQNPIALKHALRVKSAEFWLKLGQPDAALQEIESLPEKLQSHLSVLRVRLAIVRAARELNESSQTE